MERLKTKKPKFRQLKRIGTMALAATIALSVPAVSNVVEKVSPVKNIEVSAAEEQTNLMDSNETLTNFNVNHNDDREHWTHALHNTGDMLVDGPEFDVIGLKYVVKFPDELSHLFDDDYVTDYLLGNITNFDATMSPFTLTGSVIDENGERISISKDTHKPYNHINFNRETNSLEFDLNSFYTDNNLDPYISQSVSGDYIFNTLGFETPIVVPDSNMLYNGTYEFKTAIVRGNSVDLDNVSNAYSEDLVVDYSEDGEYPEPEPEEPEVDTTELAALLAEAEDYSEEDYTEESFEVLATAAEAALNVFHNEDATQDEVDRAADNLQAAIDGLVEEEEPEDPTDPEVDKSDLATLVEEANGYHSEDYTAESFAALTSAMAVAEEVLEDDEATEEDVDTALEALETAISGLVEVEEQDPEVETDELVELVAEAENYDAGDYTAESFEVFTAAIETAEAVLANEEATQEDVDTALEELQAAIDGLEDVIEETTPEPEPEVEKNELETALAEAEGYDAGDYTEDSFEVLTTAVEAAEVVLANEEATQEEVDIALENLETAIAGLVKDEPEKETPVEDDDVSIIDDGSGDDGEEGEGNLLPKTATSSFNMILAGFLTLLAGAGSLLLGKRKLN